MTQARFNAPEFLRAIRFVSATIERRNTIPVLGLARMTLNAGTLELSGTDLEFELKERIAYDGDAEFRAMVRPSEIVAALSGELGEALMEYDEGTPEIPAEEEGGKPTPGQPATMTISAGGVTFSVAIGRETAPEDYPSFVLKGSDKDLRRTITIGEAELEKGLRMAQNFISQEETRYYLNGICLDTREGGNLRLVATDGHRLIDYLTTARGVAPQPGEGMDDKGEPNVIPVRYIMPKKGVKLLLKAIKKGGNETLKIKFVGIKWSLELGDRTLSGKLIDGTYPDCTRVIPKEEVKTRFAITASAAKRAATYSQGAFRGAAAINPEAGTITVKNPDGHSKLTISIAKGEGEEFGLNPNHIRMIGQLLGDFEGQSGGPSCPVLISGGDGVRIVLMPMRIYHASRRPGHGGKRPNFNP